MAKYLDKIQAEEWLTKNDFRRLHQNNYSTVQFEKKLSKAVTVIFTMQMLLKKSDGYYFNHQWETSTHLKVASWYADTVTLFGKGSRHQDVRNQVEALHTEFINL